MKRELKVRLDAELSRHGDAVLAIAEARLDDFAREWRRTRKSAIELIFGMGAFVVEIDGTDEYDCDRWPSIVKELDKDLDEITDRYRAACPDNRTIRRNP